MTKTPPPDALLNPLVQDRLAVVGRGTAAQIRRAGRYAVKIAHENPRDRARLQDEINTHQRLGAPAGVLALPRLHAHNQACLVRDFVPGPVLLSLLPEVEPAVATAFFEALQCARRHQVTLGFHLDFSPANLCWDATGHRLWLFDLGRRLDPPLFEEVHHPEDVPRALEHYLAWRTQHLDRALGVQPPSPPPSGRFAVSVPCGPHPDARLLFANANAKARHGRFFSADQLLRLTNQVTFANEPAASLPATRYQDAPQKGEGFAQGDGRSLLVGEALNRSLMVKGCGPTPLKWTGNPYHEDGLVSFQRTLWETTVCDELLRLGLDVPEVWAICSAPGQRTIDQTEIEWPAAVALRASTSHHRLGHLLYFSDDRDAFFALVRHIADTDAHLGWLKPRARELSRLLHGFAVSLGKDTGLCDTLNIQCFNPTMGNVRVDGHLIDFSTVRFMDRYVPDFVYMNGNRRIREARVAHRGHIELFLTCLERMLGWTKGQRETQRKRALRLFDDGYVDGCADGLSRYLGLEAETVHALGRPSLRPWVDAFRAARKPRGPEHIVFSFWQQTAREPLYDWETFADRFVEAAAGGRRGAERTLVREGLSIPPRHREAGRRLAEVTRRLVRRLPEDIAPRPWSGIVRPFMECEALADRIYRRSTPERFGAWTVALASARALPEGTYPFADAVALARRRGHVKLSSPGRRVGHTVVGLVPEVHQRAQDAMFDLLGPRFVGAFVHGPRVTGPGPIIERGPDLFRTTPLLLMLVVRPGPDEDEDQAELDMVVRRLSSLCALYDWAVDVVTLTEGSADDVRSLGQALAATRLAPVEHLAVFAHRDGLPVPPRAT